MNSPREIIFSVNSGVLSVSRIVTCTIDSSGLLKIPLKTSPVLITATLFSKVLPRATAQLTAASAMKIKHVFFMIENCLVILSQRLIMACVAILVTIERTICLVIGYQGKSENDL